MKPIGSNNFIEAVLRGIGNVFFCDNKTSGLLFLVAICFFSPKAGFFILLNTAAATAGALLFRMDKALILSGYYGYNAALVGFYWLYFNPLSPLAMLFMVVTAGLTVPLMRLFFTILVSSRWNLPPVSWASNILTFLMIPLMIRLRITWPSFIFLPPGLNELINRTPTATSSFNLGYWANAIVPFLPAILFFVLGLLAHSKILSFHFLAGLVLGLTLALSVAGANGLFWYDYYLVLAVPLFASLSCFFLVRTPQAFFLALAALVISLPVWGALVYLGFQLHVPVFTVPFAVSVSLFVLIAKINPFRKLKRNLISVPLVLATTPEAILAWRDKELMAETFWLNLMEPSHRKEWTMRRSTRILKAAEMLFKAKRIVVFTGAGISTESKIPDYRTDFLSWKKYDTSHFQFEQFLKSEYSRQKYWEMSQDFYLVLRTAQPNPAHLALAELEAMAKLDIIITQNVDRLHQRAGNSPEKVLELHGNEMMVTCLKCGRKYNREQIYQMIVDGIKTPYCFACQGILKPDSIAFGQPMSYQLSKLAFDRTMACDLLIMIGSSLSVQPAASLPWKAKANGADLIIINIGTTPYDEHADVILRERAGKALPEIVEKLKQLMLYVS